MIRNIDSANETDIREEIATPFLSFLGYSRGTDNDILREYPLSYNKNFLGRKKNNDPPLRGRADYILSVTGAGRWVFEIKGPNEEITQDAIEQALTYARHPEVSGSYSAITNGKRFVLFYHTQRSIDEPRAVIASEQGLDPQALANQLSGVLSPSAIRRDCTLPVVDLAKPLTDGFRSRAIVTGGVITHDQVTYELDFPFPLPKSARDAIENQFAGMRGLRLAITGGEVWRDEQSRIRSKLIWNAEREEILKFMIDKKIMDAEYISLDEQISLDPNKPSTFDIIDGFQILKGDILYSTLNWRGEFVDFTMSMNYRGQAIGHVEGSSFRGNYQAEYEGIPDLPIPMKLVVHVYVLGTFNVILDSR